MVTMAVAGRETASQISAFQVMELRANHWLFHAAAAGHDKWRSWGDENAASVATRVAQRCSIIQHSMHGLVAVTLIPLASGDLN